MKHALFILLSLLFLASVAQAAESVTLRSDHSVEGEMLRLSDVFDNIDPAMDRTITAAPQPGAKMTFTPETLTLLAKRFQLLWMPVKAHPTVTIYRASTRITSDDIKEALADALMTRGIGERVDVDLDNRSAELFAAVDTRPEIIISQLHMDAKSRRFSATVSLDGYEQTLALTGRVYELIDVPVLAARLNKGDIIQNSKITFVERRLQDLAANVIVDPAKLIGKTPRRSVAEGQLIREDSLESPVLVQKGKSVVVQYQTSNMSLSVMGRAMEDGAIGDVVRVMNTTSNQTLDGEVMPDGKVKVLGRLTGKF